MEDVAWARANAVSLFVSALGQDAATYDYPTGMVSCCVPVTWAGGRAAAFSEALLEIAEHLSAGGTVCLHSNQSFHRGPILAAAVMRVLSDVEPRIFSWVAIVPTHHLAGSLQAHRAAGRTGRPVGRRCGLGCKFAV